MRPFHLILVFVVLLSILGAGTRVKAADDDAATLAQQAIAAAQKGDLPQAITLATRVVELEPKQTRGWLLRGRLYDRQHELAKAAADFSSAIKLDPELAEAWEERGEAWFKAGKFAEALTDFDAYLRLMPEQKPYHWQRGIALYYAGRFADGKRQFELHQTVNKHDVENAVWHFLCTARAEGLEAARKQLIPIDNDPRVPMAKVHELFAGKAKPKDVLAVARTVPAKSAAGEPLFYAHLYLGIYFEATGDTKQAREFILKAAERAKENGYMGDVARVHAELLRSKTPR